MNRESVADIQQTLHAWRDQGVDRLDAVRFRLIEAMAKRAADVDDGQAKRVLRTRLDELIQQYAARVEAGTPIAAAATETPSETTNGTLTAVLRQLATVAQPDKGRAPSANMSSLRESYPELPMLDEFRAIWSRVSVNRQIRQSEEQVHENAGPLNSSHLVHRALSLMREVSPGYLHQFLSYLDALAWVEQLPLGSAPPAKEAKRRANKTARKSPARKTGKTSG